MQPVELEREMVQRLPSVLATLLDQPSDEIEMRAEPVGSRAADVSIVDGNGRRWLIEVKTASSPGTVAAAAEQLAQLQPDGGLLLLAVPFMTPAGAKAAAERDLNWIDLSGNARIRDDNLFISVEGRPTQFTARGRPSSPFAPKSSRVARRLLLDPWRWWRQNELAETTHLDDGHVSRIVRRLDSDALLDRDHGLLRPRDAHLLLDAWADDYRFDRHDIVVGHLTGSGIELARAIHEGLNSDGIGHAFTGLPAAWALDRFARFRLNSVYVHGDPRDAAQSLGLRRNESGANVQLIGPNDPGVFDGERDVDDLPCVSPVQAYLDLDHLPERANEAARQLRSDGLLWSDHA
jgi:hypothetical protein